MTFLRFITQLDDRKLSKIFLYSHLPACGVAPEVAEGAGEPGVDVVQGELLVRSLQDRLHNIW